VGGFGHHPVRKPSTNEILPYTSSGGAIETIMANDCLKTLDSRFRGNDDYVCNVTFSDLNNSA
jgi:hypothetical protein